MTILVPIDFSESTARVVDVACWFARELRADLALLHASPPNTTDFYDEEPGVTYIKAMFKAGQHRMRELTAKLEAQHFIVRSRVVQDDATAAILREAKDTHADLIVMGSHGHGRLRHLFGRSVTGEVIQHSSVPVLVVPLTRLTPRSESATEHHEITAV